ncbi:MAG: cytochrome-c oxidase, cbb3-type subunit III [Bdellovibrionales bacterium]|nr:cytochrome-c oxidase, cbb3-type subunit III [Bdellovibrionales bacterium]
MSDHLKPEKDDITGVETTGHEWDGLKELNNPAPRWWLWVFLITAIWSVWYWVVYPAWPVPGGATRGTWEWTQYDELKVAQGEILQRRAKYQEKFHKASLQEILNDKEIYEFARVGGMAAFKENCAACHGTGAAGGRGYPNLNDDDWLWGGRLDDIHETLRVGINSGHEDARLTMMPAFGRDGLLKRAQVDDVVEYVHQLHLGDKAKITPAYTRGQQVFAENCVACHGANGEGDRTLGAPRLNDEIWLFGGDKQSIHTMVMQSRTGVMPAWEGRLSPDTLKALTIYIHSLGGTDPDVPVENGQ